jgi:hypothetical protein
VFSRLFLDWSALQGLPGGSTVLSRVEDVAVRREFITKLTTEWLPKPFIGRRKQVGELLYRGSRDGMTPAAFHEKCDGKGPTLVLVAGRSEGQQVCVFGGYAGKAWDSRGYFVDARDSFVFTVLNPFGDGIVKMPVNERSGYYSGQAMHCDAGQGPSFGCGFVVKRLGMSPTEVFSGWSSCALESGGTFGDPLGRGKKTFTGAYRFMPLEVEVWRVF